MLLEQEQERLSWEPREFGGRFFGEIPDRGTPAPAPSTPPAPPPPTPTPPRTPLSPIEEAARRYGYGFQPPVEAAGTPLQPAGLSPIEALLRAASEDVPYLRGEPFRTNEEQAMVERAKGRIRANFDMERQRARDSAGAYNRPLAPMLDDINRREQEALAEVDQGLMAATAGERRSRLGESRQLLSFLEALERQRQMEAMGIEMGLDEQELQRILTAVQLASGLAPAGQTTSMADRILQYALGAGQQAQQRMGQSTSGMGNLAYLWGLGGR